jgi:hypothetical protein
MKYFLSILAIFGLTIIGADFNSLKIPSVTVTVSDFTLDYSPAGRTVTLAPSAGGTALSGTSDAGGLVGFARVTPGLYTLTISGIGLNPLMLSVPNQSGTLSATNLIISAWTPPSGASYAGATAKLRAWSLLATDPLALPGALKLSGQTNQIGDNGTALTYNGAAVGGGGDTVWTNAAGVIQPAGGTTNSFAATFETPPLTGHSVDYSTEAAGDYSGTAYEFRTTHAGDNTNSSPYFIGFDSVISVAPGTNGSAAIYWNVSSAAYGGVFKANGKNINGLVPSSQSVALLGHNNTSAEMGFAVVGDVDFAFNGQTNVAVAGTTLTGGHTGVAVGIYGEVESGTGVLPSFEPAVLLLDNRDSAVPLIVARDNGVTKFNVTTNGLAIAAAGFGKGAFTGITTTNTFYSTGSGGTGIVTNVVVLQGGIVSGWTVTQ